MFVELWTDSSVSPPVKETYRGENAQRSYQQLHRTAEAHSGEGVPKAGPQHQAGESRYPGDDSELPEAAAAACSRAVSEGLQSGLLSVLEGASALPLSQLQDSTLHRSTSSTAPAAAPGPESQQPPAPLNIPRLLQSQDHHTPRHQRASLEAMVETL